MVSLSSFPSLVFQFTLLGWLLGLLHVLEHSKYGNALLLVLREGSKGLLKGVLILLHSLADSRGQGCQQLLACLCWMSEGLQDPQDDQCLLIPQPFHQARPVPFPGPETLHGRCEVPAICFSLCQLFLQLGSQLWIVLSGRKSRDARAPVLIDPEAVPSKAGIGGSFLLAVAPGSLGSSLQLRNLGEQTKTPPEIRAVQGAVTSERLPHEALCVRQLGGGLLSSSCLHFGDETKGQIVEVACMVPTAWIALSAKGEGTAVPALGLLEAPGGGCHLPQVIARLGHTDPVPQLLAQRKACTKAALCFRPVLLCLSHYPQLMPDGRLYCGFTQGAKSGQRLLIACPRLGIVALPQSNGSQVSP